MDFDAFMLIYLLGVIDAVASDVAASHPAEGKFMRTTLDIDDDVLAAVKELAQRERITAGTLISRLARRALAKHEESDQQQIRLGFRPFPSRGKLVTNEDIDHLRDKAGS
jgi:predicted transcriptional regulator